MNIPDRPAKVPVQPPRTTPAGKLWELIGALEAQTGSLGRALPAALIGNWPVEMILLFNRIGDYCEREGLTTDDAETMFNAGIAARACGTLEQFRSVPPRDDPE